MSLTAREWLLLSEEEQKRRGPELSSHECFLLRTELAYIHFTEEQKRNMSKEEKEKFLNPPRTSVKNGWEHKSVDEIIAILREDAERKKKNRELD